MKYLAIHSLSVLLTLPAGPAGVAKEEHLQLQQNASVAGLHHDTLARLSVPQCLCICGLRM